MAGFEFFARRLEKLKMLYRAYCPACIEIVDWIIAVLVSFFSKQGKRVGKFLKSLFLFLNLFLAIVLFFPKKFFEKFESIVNKPSKHKKILTIILTVFCLGCGSLIFQTVRDARSIDATSSTLLSHKIVDCDIVELGEMSLDMEDQDVAEFFSDASYLKFNGFILVIVVLIWVIFKEKIKPPRKK